MARPKANTPEGQRAKEKWQQTMIERYGSISEFARRIGRKGGENGRGPNYKGGFAGSKELASKAGAIGGRKSKRASKYIDKLEKNSDYIREYCSGKNMKKLSEELNIPYSSLVHYVNTKIKREK